MKTFFAFFERFAKPFGDENPQRPPNGGVAFIRHFANQSKGAFWLMLVFGFLEALAEAAIFMFIGVLVERMTSSGPQAFFADNTLLLLAMAVFVVLLRPIISTVGFVLEEQIIVPGFFTRIRWQSHLAVSRQDVTFFDDELSGRVSNKVWQAGQAAGDFMINLLQIGWFIAVFIATTLTVAAGFDWRLLLMVALWLFIVGLIARIFVPRIRDHGRQLAEVSSGVTGRMVDGYSNIRLVKLHGAEETNDKFIKAGWDPLMEQVFRFTRVISAMRISFRWSSSLMLAAITGTALWLFSVGQLSIGEVTVVLALCVRLNLLMGRMLGLLNGLFRNFGTVQNSAALISNEPTVVDRDGATILPPAKGDIEFANVNFRYNEAQGVLKNFSLRVPAGQRLGIVGRSGAGKSTLINLLLRFHDVSSGEISIDGTNIADVTQDSLRAQIGLVAQDTSSFNRSLKDNISYGREEASQEEIEEAAKRANAHDFIAELTDHRGNKGYETLIGERGVKLSGGQRQRIAIARLFLRNAPILLLDEATSALDSESEAAIQENLQSLMAEKTVIAIAHRLSTISHLERLIVMDEGQIIEDGTHESLLASGGLYAQLWEKQSGGFIAV